ncbi:MAG: hypothetical protein DMF04_03240 [Verrucomicrobia bacterium]|nr:MAG: hypothetical protein DMF04_03240 [Verrucomicrobiota bacterium]
MRFRRTTPTAKFRLWFVIAQPAFAQEQTAIAFEKYRKLKGHFLLTNPNDQHATIRRAKRRPTCKLQFVRCRCTQARSPVPKPRT